MKNCRPRAVIVMPQGFVTGAYATSAKEKAIAYSSTAARLRSGQSNLSANGEARGHLSGNGDVFSSFRPSLIFVVMENIRKSFNPVTIVTFFRRKCVIDASVREVVWARLKFGKVPPKILRSSQRHNNDVAAKKKRFA
jgi:hypothetical protein